MGCWQAKAIFGKRSEFWVGLEKLALLSMSGSAVLAHQIVDGKASHESMGMKWDVNTAYCACRRKNIDLIQDLHFPAACQRLKISPDGQHLFASGIHPPRVTPSASALLSCMSTLHDQYSLEPLVSSSLARKAKGCFASTSRLLRDRFPGPVHRTCFNS